MAYHGDQEGGDEHLDDQGDDDVACRVDEEGTRDDATDDRAEDAYHYGHHHPDRVGARYDQPSQGADDEASDDDADDEKCHDVMLPLL